MDNNTTLNVKASDLKDYCCDECGCMYFRQVVAFKRVSALISPTGKEQMMPMQTFRCDECGWINKEFQIKTSDEIQD